MGEAETTTPRSTAEPQVKASKDKNCPFCGQAFTSSSLGRHLDLYIRPRNPKAPDGLHVVDEIRKLRGGITRRQAKGSGSTPKRDDSGTRTPADKKQSVESEDSSMLVESPEADEDGLDVGKTRPPASHVGPGNGNGSRQPSRRGLKTADVRRDVSRQLQKADRDQRCKTSEAAEVASATEMALRELLKSVREASTKASGAGLFDFDPCKLNFPSLCLHILPAPSTLFSPTPFPTSESWSITPPGQKQLEALNRQVREQLLAHQRQRQINHVYPPGAHSTASSAANSPLPTPPLFEPDPQKLFCHIADAYNHWTHQTEKTRQECWQVEILRCYARADDKRREAEVQLENMRREVEYLKADRWTSGAAGISPITINLGGDTARELGKHGMDFRNWDYDRLIDKWRTSIRESKTAASGMAAQKPLQGRHASTRSCSLASLPPQHFIAVNQASQGSPIKLEGAMPFTAPPTVNGDSCSDQLDAEGDEDDEAVDLTPRTVSDEDPINHIQIQAPPQPTHQQQHQHHELLIQPTPVHPSQLQSHMQTPLLVTQAQAQAHIQHAQAHAQAQAQIQAQVWAAARQHMNQSRNQDFRPHQHQQLSPHVQHIASANNSRRPSLAIMDPLTLNSNTVNGMSAPMGMSTGMEGIENHQDPFLRLDMGLTNGFVGSNDGSVSMGS